MAAAQRCEREGRPATLVCLGPLTNAALAVSLDPALPTRLARCVVMGGAAFARGNDSAAAEFNFKADPEAAHVVFEAFGRAGACELAVVPWETALDASFSWAQFDLLTTETTHRLAPPPLAAQVRRLCGCYERMCRPAKGGTPSGAPVPPRSAALGRVARQQRTLFAAHRRCIEGRPVGTGAATDGPRCPVVAAGGTWQPGCKGGIHERPR